MRAISVKMHWEDTDDDIRNILMFFKEISFFFFKEVSSAHQACIYLIQSTAKTEKFEKNIYIPVYLK